MSDRIVKLIQEGEMKTIYIDIGSSTIKVYTVEEKAVKLQETKSLPFKKEISPDAGLSENLKKELIDYVNSVKDKYEADRTRVFATAVFRKLSMPAYRRLADDFFE